jgi:hypothetical protein
MAAKSRPCGGLGFGKGPSAQPVASSHLALSRARHPEGEGLGARTSARR